jgi:transcriptional regulator with XRE-family HTH domain
MGKATRRKPKRLAEKLAQIRASLGLSQNEMINRLGLVRKLTQAEVSAFERGVREPPLPFLLEYARAARVCVETLIDDALDLPDRNPGTPKRRRSLKRAPK